MSGLFGGKTKSTTTQKFDTGPSSFQTPFLNTAFGGAQADYDASKGTPYYQGETYAGLTADQKAALGNLKTYASGAGMSAANSISAFGSNLIGYGDKAGSMTDAYAAMAAEDPTQANLKAAAAYADNPNIQGMIDANSRDVIRNLREDTLPGIDRAASATGNINSSRAGIAAGIAQRGAADRVADISSTIRGNAYSQGLSLAQADRASRMSAMGTAAGMYGNLGTTGATALSEGTAAGYGALDRIGQAGAIDQANRQGADDAAFAKWQGQDTRASDLLKRYYGIVGSNSWGSAGTSSGTGTNTQSGNVFGQLAGAAATAASFIPSDPRLKHVGAQIGETPDGLGIYTYHYRHDMGIDGLPTGLQVGVMADEVAKLRPDALGSSLPGGFLTVNYAAL